jgi:hypothetical protein
MLGPLLTTSLVFTGNCIIIRTRLCVFNKPINSLLQANRLGSHSRISAGTVTTVWCRPTEANQVPGPIRVNLAGFPQLGGTPDRLRVPHPNEEVACERHFACSPRCDRGAPVAASDAALRLPQLGRDVVMRERLCACSPRRDRDPPAATQTSVARRGPSAAGCSRGWTSQHASGTARARLAAIATRRTRRPGT